MIQQNNISQEEFELIEQYLNNTLPDSDAATFRLRLQNDEDLQKKTEEIRLLILGINEAILEKKLQQYHEKIIDQQKKTSTTSTIFKINKKWLAAASILLLAVVSTWWLTGRKNKNDRIYADFFKPDPGLITAMGSSEDYDFEKGMVEYKEGNYKKAIEAWSSLKPSQTKKDTLNYFLGVANLACNNNEKAKEKLLQITNDGNKPFYKDACWYLGLLFLKEGKYSEAIKWINKSGYPQSDDLINAINKK